MKSSKSLTFSNRPQL